MTDHPRFEPIRSAPDKAHLDYNGGRLVNAMLRLVEWWLAMRGSRPRGVWGSCSTGVSPMVTVAEEQISSWLGERSFASWRDEFDRRGYLIFERVLPQDRVAEIRDALAPHLARDLKGRNDFEGVKTNRVYALLAKSPVFAGLVMHPLVMAFVDAELGKSCLLSALLAINLQPGETVQPWHFDDSGAKIPRPRPPLGVSTFWAIDDTTEVNGATEIIPGSHLWDGEIIAGAVKPADFSNRAAEREISDRADAIKMTMSSGSLAITKGTLWHRGGANRSDRSRLIVTPQYCVGWVRQLENMCLAVPPESAEKLPERVRELIGYSIHPPFMGHVDGLHPKRLLRTVQEPLSVQSSPADDVARS